MGVLAYMAAWDVRRAKIFGLRKPGTGIDSFHGLVDLVMCQESYRSASRVFWITENGSSHRGQPSIARLQRWSPNAVQGHTPIHADRLNQGEMYFSVLQRQVFAPNDFKSLSSALLIFKTVFKRPAPWDRVNLSHLRQKHFHLTAI